MAQMDSSHATIGVGSGAAVGVLTGILAGTWKMDPKLAANWAMAIIGAAGGGWALALWFIKWKYPDAPPLPGELVALDPGAAARPAIAQVVQEASTPAGEPQPPAPPALTVAVVQPPAALTVVPPAAPIQPLAQAPSQVGG
jgi:hypothetical protein